VIGFLIVWLAWRQWRALAAFGGVAVLWGGSFLWLHGTAPYVDYLRVAAESMQLPYDRGFPVYLLVTVYGLLTSMFPAAAQPYLQVFVQAWMLILGTILGWIAWRACGQPLEERLVPVALAILFPLVTAPYAMVHDLVVLIPFFVLWARRSPTRRVVVAAAVVYAVAFLLPIAGYAVRIAFLAFIPLGLLWGISRRQELLVR
jgi:hypothetical protein